MNWRKKDKLIEAMFKNIPLYIINTGVQIEVDYFGSELEHSTFRNNNPNKFHICKIEFITTPTIKSLKLCKQYHIKKNSSSNKMEFDAEISLDNLSLFPFEGKAAELIYKKDKK